MVRRSSLARGSKKAEIGARLRVLRKERGMTQAELAELVGTHFANISQVERGIRGLGIEQAMKARPCAPHPIGSCVWIRRPSNRHRCAPADSCAGSSARRRCPPKTSAPCFAS